MEKMKVKHKSKAELQIEAEVEEENSKEFGGDAMANNVRKTRKVKVHRSNTDPANKDIPITVIVNNFSSKKVFNPGQVIDLEEKYIKALQSSVSETSLEIPYESGVYVATNPKRVAESLYPTMEAVVSPQTGGITMVQKTPNYIVEYI